MKIPPPPGSDTPDHRIYIQGRCNIETLASIAMFLDMQGARPDSRSDLLYKATEALLAILTLNDAISPVTRKDDAVRILESMGIKWPYGSKGHEEIVKGLSLESLELEREDTQSDDLRERAAQIMQRMKEQQGD